MSRAAFTELLVLVSLYLLAKVVGPFFEAYGTTLGNKAALETMKYGAPALAKWIVRRAVFFIPKWRRERSRKEYLAELDYRSKKLGDAPYTLVVEALRFARAAFSQGRMYRQEDREARASAQIVYRSIPRPRYQSAWTTKDLDSPKDSLIKIFEFCRAVVLFCCLASPLFVLFWMVYESSGAHDKLGIRILLGLLVVIPTWVLISLFFWAGSKIALRPFRPRGRRRESPRWRA